MFGCGWKSSPFPLFPISGCATGYLISKPFSMVIQQEGTPLNLGRNPGYGVVDIDKGNAQTDTPSKKATYKMWIYSLPSIGFIAVAVAMVLVFAFTSFGTNEDGQATLKATAAEEKYVDLESNQGRLRGYVRNSRQEREYIAFYKVPYSKSPTGELRFMEPHPVESWQGLRDEKEVAPQCIQKEKYTELINAVGEEDCLYINLYTPSVEKQSQYPTIVYFHGGFNSGNASKYGAEYFLDEDVVLITFQYRLGALSVLDSEDGVFEGNLGYKDQVMVLKWVRDNVAPYGGDPNRVTIVGNSYGGIAVSLHMVSPLSTDLFHHAITQSGANLCRNFGVIPHPKPATTVIEVGKLLNCSASSSTEILECLRSKTAAEIAVVSSPNIFLTFSIDSTSSSVFLPDTPFNLLTNKKANKVPYIIGITSEEEIGTALDILHDPELVNNLNGNWSAHAPGVLGEKGMTKEELDSIKTFYFGDKLIGNDTIRNLTNLLGDWKLAHCTYLSAVMHGEQSDTYLYYLSKPVPKSYAEKDDPNFNATARGYVAHGDEIQFQFPYYNYPVIPLGDPNYYSFSEYFVRLWAQFADSGNPSGVDGLEWSATSSRENAFWFELNDNPGRTHVLDERIQFWDQFSNTKLNYE